MNNIVLTLPRKTERKALIETITNNLSSGYVLVSKELFNKNFENAATCKLTPDISCKILPDVNPTIIQCVEDGNNNFVKIVALKNAGKLTNHGSGKNVVLVEGK